jgi:hypothetical protein
MYNSVIFILLNDIFKVFTIIFNDIINLFENASISATGFAFTGLVSSRENTRLRNVCYARMHTCLLRWVVENVIDDVTGARFRNVTLWRRFSLYDVSPP